MTKRERCCAYANVREDVAVTAVVCNVLIAPERCNASESAPEDDADTRVVSNASIKLERCNAYDDVRQVVVATVAA